MGEPHLVARPSPGNAVSFTREAVPRLWAQTQNNLGCALHLLGRHEKGTALLEQAVKTYLASLQEKRREIVPLDWALTQNKLGLALRELGERETGTHTARMGHGSKQSRLCPA